MPTSRFKSRFPFVIWMRPMDLFFLSRSSIYDMSVISQTSGSSCGNVEVGAIFYPNFYRWFNRVQLISTKKKVSDHFQRPAMSTAVALAQGAGAAREVWAQSPATHQLHRNIPSIPSNHHSAIVIQNNLYSNPEIHH